jgi:hypothetical protein
MKKIIFLLAALLIAAESYSQKNPSINISVGISNPSGNMSGDLVYVNDEGYMYIDSNFIKTNYSASTGTTVTGSLKFPIDKRGVVNGLLLGSYTNFTAFTSSNFGTREIITTAGPIRVPVTYDHRFTTSTFAFGLDFTPLPEAKFSPFINPNLSLNIISLSISRQDNQLIRESNFNDAFRIGALINGGFQYRINNEYSFILSTAYHFANLLLKSNSSGFGERLDLNYSSGLSINDAEGEFWSNLPSPNEQPKLYKGETKNINWWNLMIGLNIKLGK